VSQSLALMLTRPLHVAGGAVLGYLPGGGLELGVVEVWLPLLLVEVSCPARR
jgi:hypothetical protein